MFEYAPDALRAANFGIHLYTQAAVSEGFSPSQRSAESVFSQNKILLVDVLTAGGEKDQQQHQSVHVSAAPDQQGSAPIGQEAESHFLLFNTPAFSKHQSHNRAAQE